MAFFKIAFVAALVASAVARPQFDVITGTNTASNPQQIPGFNDPNSPNFMFDPNPTYTYQYQVASDEEQTYIAHQENRDGADVQGEYSYVDPLGSLITVTYTAGADGYQESRNVQENFVTVRSKPVVKAATAVTGNAARVSQVVQQVRPAVRRVVSQTTSSSGSDSDLVARIISQLTPFIRNTVSGSLGGSTSTTTRTVQAAPVTRTVVSAAPAVTRTVEVTSQPAGSAVTNIFGTGGANNVRFETPEFDFAYDLSRK